MQFKIHNLGKIKEANIELKQLTFFIGKNGSGKTYCASAIWSILNYVRSVKKNDHIDKKSDLSKFLKRIGSIELENHSLVFKKEECFALRKSIQNEINSNIQQILKDAIGPINFDDAKIEVVNEEDTSIELSVKIEKKPILDEFPIGNSSNKEKNRNNTPCKMEYILKVNNTICRKFVIEDIYLPMISIILKQEIFQDIIGYAFFGIEWIKYQKTAYLPAARTGIMLAINYFVEGALQRSVLNAAEGLGLNDTEGLGPITSLPFPLQDFAKKMYRPQFYGTDYKKINSSHPLEDIVQGKLFKKSRGEVSFKPNDCSTVIPLSASSSLVTELAGLYLLGDRVHDNFLIFEEPEAHLHLEAQREIAKYLAKLVNSGAKILITTHSDTFLQQINNLITLSDHPKRNELIKNLKINDFEVIERESVLAYEFLSPANGQGIVKEIELSKTGFIAKSLNDVLIKLTEETMIINGELEDDE